MAITIYLHFIIYKNNKVQFDWWWQTGCHIPVVPGPLVYMSYGNGFRLVWLNKGGSMLEPIKDPWWWSNCSLLGERQGSILCTLITQHFDGILSNPCMINYYYLHYYLFICIIISCHIYCFCWTLHWHKTTADTSRCAWHFFGLNRSLLLIMKQQLIWIKAQTRLQPILDRNCRGMFSHELEVKWMIINQ